MIESTTFVEKLTDTLGSTLVQTGHTWEIENDHLKEVSLGFWVLDPVVDGIQVKLWVRSKTSSCLKVKVGKGKGRPFVVSDDETVDLGAIVDKICDYVSAHASEKCPKVIDMEFHDGDKADPF